MPTKREEYDAFRVLLGESQERLDEIHKLADEYRARIGPPVRWEPGSSDSDLDTDHVPLTPPESPKREDHFSNGPDLSIKAWNRRKWSDLSIGIETRDSGFDDFETWRAHVISEYHAKALPIPTSIHKTGVCKKRRRTDITNSER